MRRYICTHMAAIADSCPGASALAVRPGYRHVQRRLRMTLVYSLLWHCWTPLELRAQRSLELTVRPTRVLHIDPATPDTKIRDVAASSWGLGVLAQGVLPQIWIVSTGGARAPRQLAPPRPARSWAGAQALAADSAHLFVLMPAHNRVTRIRVRDGRVQHIPITINATTICALGGRLFLLGHADGAVIHEVNVTGRVVRSFGEPLISNASPIAARSVSRGILFCDQEADQLTVASFVRRDVRTFSRTGRLLWSTSLSGFQQVLIEATKTSASYTMPRSGYHSTIESVTPVGKQFVLVQIDRMPRRPGLLPEGRLLDKTTGKELAVTARMDRIVASGNGHWYFVRPDSLSPISQRSLTIVQKGGR